MTCSNCSNPVGPDGLVLTPPGDNKTVSPIAALCELCLTGVTVAKLVISRETATGPFVYDGYLPVSAK